MNRNTQHNTVNRRVGQGEERINTKTGKWDASNQSSKRKTKNNNIKKRKGPMGFRGGSMAENPPAKQETRVQSLGWKDPLEGDMATHSSILAWRIPWTEEPGGLWSMGSQRIRHN